MRDVGDVLDVFPIPNGEIEAAADSDAVGLDGAGPEERVVDVHAQFIEGVRVVLHSVADYRPGCAAM